MPYKGTIPRTCEACATAFMARPSDITKRGARFCSYRCKVVAQTGKCTPLAERFSRWVDVRSPDECWPWTGSLDPRGYGQIKGEDGRTLKAHRVALEYSIGRPLVAGEWALHKCDNPRCCNGSHLFIGDALSNVRDMWAKNRGSRRGAVGNANVNAKLNDDAIRAIRALGNIGWTYGRIARAFGISVMTTGRIVRREAWCHVS